MNTVITGYQPIIDHNNKTYSYEWYYRQKEDLDVSVATSHLIETLINQTNMNNNLVTDAIFVNIDVRFLATGLVETLPTGKFIFDIASSLQLRSKDIEMVSYLYKRGCRFSLDNINLNDDWEKRFEGILSMISFLKIDIASVCADDIQAINSLKPSYTLIAHKIETELEYELAKELGFKLFQGYYIGKPELKKFIKIPILKRSVFDLYKLLQEDYNVNTLSDFFESHLDLGLTFLQYLSNLTFKDKEINAFSDAIALLGKQKLMDWILMLIYSKVGVDSSEKIHNFYKDLQTELEIIQAAMGDNKNKFLALSTLSNNYYLGASLK